MRRLLTEKEAAEYLGTSPKTLQHRRYNGAEPPFVKMGGSVRYDLADLDAFIDARKRRSTSDRSAAA